MADTAYTPDHPEDEMIYPPNRHVIIVAGKWARAEQERLEREYGLQDGRRKRTPGGTFP